MKLKKKKSGSPLVPFVTALIILMGLTIGGARHLYANHAVPVLPQFNLMDIKGNTVTNDVFKSKYIFLQFVDGKSIDDIDLLEKVYFNWIDEQVAIMVIPRNLQILSERLSIDRDEITIIDGDYEALRKQFGAPPCCEAFFLVDPAGRIIKTDFNSKGYEKAVKTVLAGLIKNKFFNVDQIVRVNDNIKNIPWMSQFHHLIQKGDKDFYIVSMMTAICGSCLSGALAENLQRIHRRLKDRLQVITLLPTDYSDTDIKNMRRFLQLQYPLIRADGQLNRQWLRLIDEFSLNDLTNIVILLDKNGTVMDIAGNNHNQLKKFFNSTLSILKQSNQSKQSKQSHQNNRENLKAENKVKRGKQS